MNIQELIQSHRPRTEFHGDWINYDCPFCEGGSDPNKLYCGYNTSFNYVNCWICGGHSVLKLVHTLTGLGWTESKKLLKGLDVYRPQEFVRSRGKLILPEGIGPLLPAHKKYLRSRGFDPKSISRLWGVQGIGLGVRLQWRLFIPVVFGGATVSWTTRSIGRSGSRYISASADQEAVCHKDLLYGEDAARHSIIIVEGPTDVWRIGPGAVATLGTGVRRSQLLRMSKYLVRAVCYDNELAAQRRARNLCSELSVFPGETHLVELDAADAGSATDKEIKKLRRAFLE